MFKILTPSCILFPGTDDDVIDALASQANQGQSLNKGRLHHGLLALNGNSTIHN